MVDVAPLAPDSEEETSQDEYRQAWLNVIIDELLLECYEGLL